MNLAYIKEYKEVDKALLPIGSLEQHGYHLPFGTDTIIAERIAEEVSKRIRCILLPPIYYSLSHEHKPFFNVSIKNNTLADLVYDISESLKDYGVKKLFIINGHAGNTQLLESLPKMDPSIYILSYWLTLDRFGHADEIETSLMLAIAPELVDMSKAEEGKVKINDELLFSRLILARGSISKVSENGIIGDPRGASREKGIRLLEEISNRFVELINKLDRL